MVYFKVSCHSILLGLLDSKNECILYEYELSELFLQVVTVF